MKKLTILDEIKKLGRGDIISYYGRKALEAVKQDGYALRYVKEQTVEICLEAVKQNGYALQYVNEKLFCTKRLVTLELTDEQLEKIKNIINN